MAKLSVRLKAHRHIYIHNDIGNAAQGCLRGGTWAAAVSIGNGLIVWTLK
jgi:hypothetical protein